MCTASPYSLANAGDFVWLIGNAGQFPRLNSWAYNETEIWNDPVIQWSEDERFVQCTAQDAIPTNTEFAATIPLSSGNTSADAYHISNVTFIGNDDEFRASVGTINYARLTAPNVVAYATSNYDARQVLTATPGWPMGIGDVYDVESHLYLKTFNSVAPSTHEQIAFSRVDIDVSHFSAVYRDSGNTWDLNWAIMTPTGMVFGSITVDAQIGFDLTATSLRINKNRHPIRVRAWSWTDHQHYLQGVTDEIRSSNISIGARGWINKF